MAKRIARIAFEQGGLFALAVLGCYLWLAPTHVVDAENASFATLGTLGGVAHPSGYPGYVLWLRATSWLPGESPAHVTALATAIQGWASIMVMRAACRAWGAGPLAATLAAAIFAGAPIVLVMYTEAEVFAMNGLVVALVLWLAPAGGPLRGAWRAAALGLVAGIGLTDHLTCALVAPVGIYGVVLAGRETGHLRAVIVAVGALAIGLLPYAYLFVASDNEASWGTVDTLRDLLRVFLRTEYGGPGAFAPTPTPIPVSTNMLAFADALGRTWLWLPGLAGLVALVERCLRAREARWAWRMLAASFVLSGPLLVFRFNIEPVDLGLYVVHRFHLMPLLLLVVPVAYAIDRALARVAITATPLAQGVAIAAFAAATGTALGHVQRVHAPAVEQHALDMLQSLPFAAVVVGVDDDVFAATNYVQLALGVRTDVDYVHKSLFSTSWYRARLVRRGFDLDDLISDMQRRGRPTFMAAYNRDVFKRMPHYPYGLVERVLPMGAHEPPIDDVIATNVKLFKGFELDFARPGAHDEFPAFIQARYARPWYVLARALEANGRLDAARATRELAIKMGPLP